MRIDSHHHFWNYDPVRHSWIDQSMVAIQRSFLPEDLRPALKKNHIDGTILVQVDQTEDETNQFLDLAAKNEFIMGVVGWVDLQDSNVRDRLEVFSQFEKIVGFRHIVQGEPDDSFMLREDFLRGISALQDFDYTYDILVFPRQLPAAIVLAERFPNQSFVLDHIAKPLIKAGKIEPWASHIQELGKCENVFCKVSGMITEAGYDTWSADQIKPYLDVVFEAFGVDRIMFGSDWPVCLVAGSYDKVIGLIEGYTKNLGSSEREKIFGLNAQEFYRLGR